jgi:hypothetical protein
MKCINEHPRILLAYRFDTIDKLIDDLRLYRYTYIEFYVYEWSQTHKNKQEVFSLI